MIQWVKNLYRYFRHRTPIELGIEGELSKIREEFDELTDAYNQNKKFFAAVECTDLISSVGMFSYKKIGVPLFMIIIFAYIRKPYKWIRNPILHKIYGKRSEVFGNETWLDKDNPSMV